MLPKWAGVKPSIIVLPATKIHIKAFIIHNFPLENKKTNHIHSTSMLPTRHLAALEVGLIFIDILQGFSSFLISLTDQDKYHINEYTHITSYAYL